MAKTSKTWRVHVFRPGNRSDRLCIFEISAMKYDTAIKRAKEKVYKMGKLAHFYTYVGVESNN